ncbi:GGDEF domain-containing protein [Propionivibrio sp.]|uniref:GGDEF domain-containing protein n=1 Tax=Propionivibrio sp. TaxID=2212460 RepID=UPI00260F7414|nr:GGDEF domain-containing protein [Propionivibrio sp.]
MRRPADFINALLNSAASPYLRVSAWLLALLVAMGLGYLRVSTDAEYAFASTIILPVVVIAWIGGRKDGIAFSALASLMWMSTDLLADRLFSAAWIPVLNGLTRFAVYALIAWLVAALRQALLKEQLLARHDTLTGLLNRRAFFEVGQEETQRARRYGHALGIAFLDLDNFKRLNDTQGHEAGDRALKAVAAALLGSLRATDQVARLGGDEFAVVLPEATFAAATEAGNKLAGAINHALRDYPPVSVSVGVAWFEQVTAGFDEMVKAADTLMYEIKETGKQGVRSKHFPANGPAPDETENP